MQYQNLMEHGFVNPDYHMLPHLFAGRAELLLYFPHFYEYVEPPSILSARVKSSNPDNRMVPPSCQEEIDASNPDSHVVPHLVK